MKHPSAASPPPSPPRDAADPAIGSTLRNGSLQLLQALGGGGMGRVYKAFDQRLNRVVAIKMLRPEQQNDEANIYFEREARAASKLRHPNIIQILDFGREPDHTHFLVMEFIEGHSLADLIEQAFPLPPQRTIHILTQILAALEVAHTARIIHRDLKPENIMLQDLPGQPDFVKILDFGIAKNLAPEASVGPITQRGLLMGTPHFMAPEQVLGHEIDGRTDLYAIGAILYQILTAHLPFEGKQVMHILARVVSEQPSPPSTRAPNVPIDPSLEAFALRALRKNMESRFQSASEFRAALLERLHELNLPSSDSFTAPRSLTAPRKLAPDDLSPIRAQSHSILSDSVFDLADAQINPATCDVTYLLTTLAIRSSSPLPPPDLELTIRRFHGTCFRPQSGLFIALFGFPRPLEDSPLTAFHASQALLQSTPDLCIALSYGSISISNHQPQSALGAPIDLASSLASSLLPGDIVADDSLHLSSSSLTLSPHPSHPSLLIPSLPSIAPPPLSSLNLRIPLLGRSDEQTQIQQWLSSAFSGDASLFLISGTEGIGKSRLLSYAARYAESQRAVALEISSERFPHAIPALCLRRLLHAALNLVPASDHLDALALLQLPLPEHETLLALLHDQPPHGDPRFWTSSLCASFCSLLRITSASQPILITLDTCEHLDPISADVLPSLPARLGPSPVAFILAFRSSEQPLSPSTTPTSTPLPSSSPLSPPFSIPPQTPSLHLTPIPDDTLRPVLLDLLPPGAEPHLPHLFSIIQGRPDLLHLILDALLHDQPSPQTIASLSPSRALSARLRRLSHGARRLAAFAAALGSSFPMDTLEGSVPDRWQLRENLKIIGNANLLSLHDDPFGSWLQFTPPALAPKALETLPDETRTQIHLLVARHYQRTRPDTPSPNHDFQWARHLLAGGHPQNALKMFTLATDNALRIFGPSAALPILPSLLSTLETLYPAHTLPFQRIILKTLSIYSRANLHALVLSTAQHLLPDSALPPDFIRAERDLLRAQATLSLGDRKDALSLFSQAISSTPKDQPLLCAQIHLQRALAMYALSRAPEAIQDALMASQLLTPFPCPLPRPHADLSWRPNFLIGLIQQQRQQHPRAIPAFSRALEGATAQNDDLGVASSSLHLALSLSSLNRHDEALSSLQAASSCASRCSDLLTLARSLHETALLQVELNQRADALDSFFSSLSLSCDIDWQDGIRLNRLWIKRLQPS